MVKASRRDPESRSQESVWRQRSARRSGQRTVGVKGASHWSSEEQRLLKEMWQDGKPHQEIAETLGRGKTAVVHQRIRLGLPARNPRVIWTPHDEARLAGMWRAGMCIKHIAWDLGRTRAAIKTKRDQMGLPPRRTFDKTAFIRLFMSPDLKKQVQRRASERRQAYSDYIRALIARDLGFF